ncbi:MAG: O-methyltransferase [Sphingomonadaceae bacterium]
MDEEQWRRVDEFLVARLLGDDPELAAALDANEAADLPAIDVSPAQGRLLTILARMADARDVLEIGTLGGYSTICLARALPEGGRIVTLEKDPEYAAVARANLERAGLAEKVSIRIGDALETLPEIAAAGEGPFDLFFIDADKKSNPDYVRWALRLARPGSLIIIDNVVREGRVLDADSGDPDIAATRALFDLLAGEARLTATAIQTVGVKGWDGLALALVD